ncbi:MAG TPA: 4Fe-4S binding protein [Syntrophomonadaceae bacterium]|nr:4Fe-4S binding protein [Syntrophomonadaceae bacterium]
MNTWLFAPLVVVILILLIWMHLERSIRPQASTRAYWSLSSLPLSKKLEGYFYAAKTHLYLKPATWSRFQNGDPSTESADSYHGKVLTGEDAVKLISLQQPVEIRDLDHVIPYPLARDIILNDPGQSLVVMHCPCREQKPDGCQPREVCLVVGEPFASFVVDHQPGRARRITLEEALDILNDEEQRGHVHSAWFKDVMHNRFYAICNCCPCCCLGMKSFFRGVARLTHSGYQPHLDEESCSACGCCSDICPFSALSLKDNRIFFDQEHCMGCGLCVSHCPLEAIHLELAPHKGVPLNITRLADRARIS